MRARRPTWKGHIVLPRTIDARTATARIANALREESASEIVASDDAVRFRVATFRFVGNWNQLTAVTRGDLQVHETPDELRVSFELDVGRLVVAGVVLPLVLLSIGALNGMPGAFFLVAAPAMALYLIGANLALLAYRFPRFLRRAIG